MYYSEIGRIIEAGLERDRDKVASFAHLLAKKWRQMEKKKEAKELKIF